MRLERLAFVLAFVACDAGLRLPPAPDAEPPRVESLTPEAAHAGWSLELRGAGFGVDPAAVEVSFTGASAVRPATVEDGLLRVTVPLDAATGPITVRTPAGSGSSTVAFTMRGRDRLLSPRVVAEVDLRAPIVKAVSAGDGLFAWAGDPYHRIVGFDGDAYVSISTGTPRALVGAGAYVAFLQTDGEDPCAADLVLATTEVPLRVVAVQRLSEEEVDDECTGPVDLAFNANDGGWLLVTARNEAWFVEVGAGTLGEPAPLSAAGIAGIDLAAHPLAGRVVSSFQTGLAPAAAFLLAEPRALLHLELFEGTWRLVRRAPSSLEGELVAIDDGAALSSLGELGRFTPGTEFEVAEGSWLNIGDPAGAAISLDRQAGTVLVSAPGRDRVFVLMGEGSGYRFVAGHELAGAERASLLPDGRWLLGVAGGFVEVSTRTGAIIDRHPVAGRFHPPALRRLLVEDARPVDWVEVASETFGRLRRFTANGLQEEIYFQGPLRDGASIRGIAAAPLGGDLLVLRRDGQVGRLADTEFPSEEEWEPLVLQPGWTSIRDVAVSEDGALALLVVGTDDGDRVSLTPLGSAWPGELGPLLDPDVGTIARVRAGQGRLVVFGTEGGRLIELDAARAGRVVPVGPERLEPPEAFELGGVSLVEGHLVWTGKARAFYDFVAVVRLSDGAELARTETIFFSELQGLTVSPGGRHLWWVGPDPAGALLGEGTLALEQAIPDIERVALRLAPGATRLVPTPSGERVYVLDDTNDRLQLVE